MTSREEQLWNYLDGNKVPDEKASLEKAAAADETLRRELELRRKLHEHLGRMEAEQPSLRFTRNLMERLPQLYRRVQLSPLVRPLWVKAYLAAFALTVLCLFGLGLLSNTSSLIPFTFDLEGDLFSLEVDAAISLRLTVIVTSVGAAVLFLFWLDKRLRKKYEET